MCEENQVKRNSMLAYPLKPLFHPGRHGVILLGVFADTAVLFDGGGRRRVLVKTRSSHALWTPKFPPSPRPQLRWNWNGRHTFWLARDLAYLWYWYFNILSLNKMKKPDTRHDTTITWFTGFTTCYLTSTCFVYVSASSQISSNRNKLHRKLETFLFAQPRFPDLVTSVTTY